GWIVIGIAVLAIVIAFAIAASRRRRTGNLRGQFGPEYERTVERAGGRGAAESDLEQRRQRREQLRIVPLDPAARQRHMEAWRAMQARFVDDPGRVVANADALVLQVMRERGYPMDDFDQRAADVSVDHPRVVENYRAAHRVSLS